MGKDFAAMADKWGSNEDSPDMRIAKDPWANPTEATVTQSKVVHIKILTSQFVGSTFLTLFTAPLTTAYISLQLSVLANKNAAMASMASPLSDAKELANLPKDITPAQRRKYELMVKSGMEGQRAFKAPVYNSYRQVFTALGNQGLLGFYKGNGLGLVHLFFTNNLKFMAIWPAEKNALLKHEELTDIARLGYYTATGIAVDTIFQPLHVLQSRFILQNRLAKFYTYKSVLAAGKKHMASGGLGEFWQGNLANIPKNILLGGMFDQNALTQNPGVWIFTVFGSAWAVYPFLTAQRRLECQSQVGGMLTKRYSGVLHALRLIRQEEGFRGLYRGFLGFCAVNSLVT